MRNPTLPLLVLFLLAWPLSTSPTQFNLLVGLEVANADERPAWKAGDFFGEMFGRGRASDRTE